MAHTKKNDLRDAQPAPSAQKHVLEVRHLSTSFFTQDGEVKAVSDVSYYLDEQEVIAIVGESGCGKSVMQLSTLQLLQSPPGKILSGEVIFEGRDILRYGRNSKEMRAIRGDGISMVFQEPMTSLDPVYTVGDQLVEVIRTHHPELSKKDAWKVGVDSLKKVGIPEPEERMKAYPFEMSGGMRQRVMIAIAIACRSKVLIADEPTAALDVTTQAQVMDLLQSIIDELKTSMIVVTHNLGLITRYASRVYVMYAGRLIESGRTEDIMKRPKHPYTATLLKAVPVLGGDRSRDLQTIPGNPPVMSRLDDHCAFRSRCPYATEACGRQPIPELKPAGEHGHCVACYLNNGGGIQ